MNTVATHRTAGTRITFAASLLAGCLLSTVSVVANATPSDDTPSVVVEYDAQTLATESGLRTLYRRLVLAARQVCPESPARDLIRLTATQQCQKESIARALRHIDNPQLAQMFVGSANRG